MRRKFLNLGDCFVIRIQKFYNNYMIEFFQALFDPFVPFLRYSFLAGMLASVAFGIIGSYVVTRRITYIAGAIAHCVLGGIGAALYMQYQLGIGWINPIHGATASALAAALIIGMVTLYARQREDTVIGALWAVGMATGALFLARAPGAYVDPMSYLFGDITLIDVRNLQLIAALDLLVVVLAVVFYNRFLAVCFDEEFARLRGVRVGGFYMLLLCLTALTIVLLVQLVGIVMVIALLTLPPAIAGHFTARLSIMMVISILLCAAFTSLGLGLSYSWELPGGPVIIIMAAGCYLAVTVTKKLLE